MPSLSIVTLLRNVCIRNDDPFLIADQIPNDIIMATHQKILLTPTIRPFGLVASLVALLTSSFAEEKPTPIETISVSVDREAALTAPNVKAARAEMSNIPGGNTVIAAEDYQHGRSATYRDMLGWAPGVTVQPRFGAEEARLSIRGSGTSRTFHMRGLTQLQDGFAINQADGTGDFQAIEPGTLDHIEVYRGGNGLRYGAASLGGAINYVSPTGRSAPTALLRLESGSFGYVRALAATGGHRDDVGWYVSASGFRQDGYRQHSEQNTVRGTANFGYRLTDQIENRLFLSASDSESELPGSLTKAQFEADPQQATLQSFDQKRDYPLYRVADIISGVWGTERFDVGLSWTNKDLFHPLAFSPSFGPVIDQYSNDYAGMIRFVSEAPISDFANRFTFGFNAAIGYMNDDRYVNVNGGYGPLTSSADLTAQSLELYSEDRFFILPEFSVIIGVQVGEYKRDYTDTFLSDGDGSGSRTFHAINPKIGAIWDACKEAQLYTNFSRSYEPPTWGDLTTGSPVRFATDVQAQKAWTAEIGSRGNTDDYTYDLTFYYAWVDQELLSYQVSPGQSRTLNADKTTHVGIEYGSAITVLRHALLERDRFDLNLLYNWGQFTFDNDRAYGNNTIPGLPEHAIRGELMWHYEGWYIGAGLEWQSAYALDYANTTDNDSFVLVNARAGYRTRKGLSVFIDGRNLSDEKHAPTTGIANPATAVANQALYMPGDGLSVFGGVEWTY